MNGNETIKELREEVKRLKNENESLWFMLDELKKGFEMFTERPRDYTQTSTD